MDWCFIQALEFGLPRAGAWGLGFDRLAPYLTIPRMFHRRPLIGSDYRAVVNGDRHGPETGCVGADDSALGGGGEPPPIERYLPCRQPAARQAVDSTVGHNDDRGERGSHWWPLRQA